MSVTPAFYSKEPSYAILPDSRAVHSDYLFWMEYWRQIRDCVMGQIMIKRRNTVYLPKMEKQTDQEYQAFLRRAIFYNVTARTVNGLVGAVHQRPAIMDNVPKNLNLKSITRDGQSFETFTKRITRQVIQVGRYGVLVDAPQNGGRPYLCGYNAQDILDWDTVLRQDREVITKVVLREFVKNTTTGSPFNMEQKQVFRVLYLDDSGVYRQRYYPEGLNQTEVFYEITPTKNGVPLGQIPFLFFGPEDFGADIEKPPMLDISLLNIAHYQCYAQLQAGRYYTAMPIWSIFLQGGGTDDVQFTIGPNTIWQLGQHDRVQLIEFSGSGLKYLENALTSIQQQIAAIGGKFATATRGVAAQSETGIEARNRAQASLLNSVISSMNDGCTKLLQMLADWNGDLWKDIKVRFVSDATEMYMNAREIRAIQSLYESGLLPVQVIYGVFRDANIIPAEMGLREFKELLPDNTPKTEQKIVQADAKAQIKRRQNIRQTVAIQKVKQELEVKTAEQTAKINQGTPDAGPQSQGIQSYR